MEDHSAEVIVRLSAPAAQTVLVDYTTQSGTAVEGSDFLPARGRLAFPPGETEKTVSAFVIGDSKDEAEEYFSIVLENPQNASLGGAQARVTILDGQVGSDPGADTLQGLSVTDTYTAYHDGFEGSMGVDGCRAGGWMRHDQNLNDRLSYRVQVDETVIFTGDANRYRGDLTDICPPGDCAYDANLAYTGKLSPNADHVIRVEGQ